MIELGLTGPAKPYCHLRHEREAQRIMSLRMCVDQGVGERGGDAFAERVAIQLDLGADFSGGFDPDLVFWFVFLLFVPGEVWVGSCRVGSGRFAGFRFAFSQWVLGHLGYRADSSLGCLKFWIVLLAYFPFFSNCIFGFDFVHNHSQN